MVAVIEVKSVLSTHLRREGYGQLLQRAETVLDQQPRRTWVLGVLADGRSVEVIRFCHIGCTAAVIAFCRSGMFSLERTAQSAGLKLLARLMLASASELGTQCLCCQRGGKPEHLKKTWRCFGKCACARLT